MEQIFVAMLGGIYTMIVLAIGIGLGRDRSNQE